MKVKCISRDQPLCKVRLTKMLPFAKRVQELFPEEMYQGEDNEAVRDCQVRDTLLGLLATTENTNTMCEYCKLLVKL